MYLCKTIGEILENERKKNGISRRDLCDGLCDKSTYARYENDIYVPEKMLLDRFMERLGVNPNKITYVASSEEIQCQKAQVEIRDAIRNENYSLASKQVDIFKKKYNRKNRFTEQFTLFAEGYLSEAAGDIGNAAELYDRAFKITEEGMQKTLYSLMEYDIKLKIISLRDDAVDQLQLEEKFLREKKDEHILKIAFYGKVIYYLCSYSIGMIVPKKLVEILDKGLEYKYKICQMNGISELLKVKLKVLGKLTEEEQLLIDAEEIFRIESEKVGVCNCDSI